MPTPILYRDRVDVLLDRGMMSCYDAKTGEALHVKKRIGSSGQLTASLLAWDGKIFCFGESGEMVVIQAGDEFKRLGQNDLGELIMATPAIAGDRLLIRTAKHLFCLKKSQLDWLPIEAQQPRCDRVHQYRLLLPYPDLLHTGVQTFFHLSVNVHHLLFDEGVFNLPANFINCILICF